MQLGRVIGHAVATVKHATMHGSRLLIVQLIGVDDQDDGDPQLAICPVNCGLGDRVIMSSDGAAIRELLKSKQTPVRWFVLGIVDS